MHRFSHDDHQNLCEEGVRLRALAKSVIDRPRNIRILERQDQLLVALILDRREFLPDGEFTTLQAVERLGWERIKIAVAVERAMILCLDDD